MAFKLVESARDRLRAVNAPHLVVLVRAGVTFNNGKLAERPGQETQPEAARTIVSTGLGNCSGVDG
jgi:putative transposase